MPVRPGVRRSRKINDEGSCIPRWKIDQEPLVRSAAIVTFTSTKCPSSVTM